MPSAGFTTGYWMLPFSQNWTVNDTGRLWPGLIVTTGGSMISGFSSRPTPSTWSVIGDASSKVSVTFDRSLAERFSFRTTGISTTPSTGTSGSK
tara:strand:- start:1915 stop:2196 length:282 start_codon:yes stop_codon:yes gene_type:complete